MEESVIELIDVKEKVNITEYSSEYSVIGAFSDKSSSGVWKYFGSLKHNDFIDNRFVYCVPCFEDKKIKKYHRSTSTGNLCKHLKRHHQIAVNQPYRVRKDADSIVSIQPEEPDNETMVDECEVIVYDINEILISEVAKRPSLYNALSCTPNKGNKYKTRQQLWKEIYDSMHHIIPLGRLPKIWKNIRDRYQKVRRSVAYASAMATARPKYKYFDMLRFLDDVDKTSTSNELESEQFDDELENELEISESEEFPPKRIKLSPVMINVKPEPGKNPETTRIEEGEFNEFDVDALPRLEQINYSECKQDVAVEEMTACYSTPVSTSTQQLLAEKTDEFDDFGSFVAKVMRNMTKQKSRKLQMNILQFISEIEDE